MYLYLIWLTTISASFVHSEYQGHYTNDFAVQIEGGTEKAKNVSQALGYKLIGPLDVLDDHYLIRHDKVPRLQKRESHEHIIQLAAHPEIIWSQQLLAKERVKRNPLSLELTADDRDIEGAAYGKLAKRINDPMWTKAKQDWYMFDHKKTPAEDKLSVKTDLGVLRVWQKGYTGKNISVTILDDGLEWNHTDIYKNYAPHASYDLNDDDSDPFPRYDFTNENQHGTRCAGVIAMVANNSFCGVGIAPNAKVGGIRMLDGPVTDAVESRALSFNAENIDIMSASWGPSDNGKMVDGPGKLSAAGFEKGITKGRHGLGIIYVWASGNGGHRGDNCECDGYVSSPYTISISSASTRLKSPYYVERCPSTMATTFSSGGYNELQIVSATLHNKCTEYFTGTSAAAPQAAGIVALVLEANPRLTWRDVQHLIVWSASPYVLYNNPGWQTNAAGFKVNHRFGFGLMNAIEMVELAEIWKNVGPRKQCDVTVTSELPRAVSPNQTADIDIRVPDDCVVNYLEHIELVMTVNYTKRGDLSLDLISAQGTPVSMMRPRSNDYNDSGYKNWPFMSVQTWGENPHGVWKAKLFDNHKGSSEHGNVEAVTLRLYGTSDMPDIMKRSRGHRRSYNFQLSDIIKNKFCDLPGSGWTTPVVCSEQLSFYDSVLITPLCKICKNQNFTTNTIKPCIPASLNVSTCPEYFQTHFGSWPYLG